MPMPDFIKKKIEDSDSEDSAEDSEDSDSPADKGKAAARAKNPMLNWAKNRLS